MPARRPRDPRVMTAFTRFAEEYVVERERLEREQQALMTRRDDMIRKAHKAGLSHEEISEALQLTRQRVSRIIRPR